MSTSHNILQNDLGQSSGKQLTVIQYSQHPQAVKSRSRRDYLRTYQKTWISQRRREWLEANGPCCKCGSSDRLEVDHIDPSQKQINPRALWSLSPQNPRRIAELAKCQVLCHECHKEKTRPLLAAKAEKESLVRPRNSAGQWIAKEGGLPGYAAQSGSWNPMEDFNEQRQKEKKVNPDRKAGNYRFPTEVGRGHSRMAQVGGPSSFPTLSFKKGQA